jgi:hypothetical protein
MNRLYECSTEAGFHTGKRAHPQVIGFSTHDATLTTVATADSIPLPPVAASAASAKPNPGAASASLSASSASAAKSQRVSSTGQDGDSSAAASASARSSTPVSYQQNQQQSLQPAHSDEEAAAENADIAAEAAHSPAVLFGSHVLPAHRVEPQWALSTHQADCLDALRAYGTIMAVRPVHGWPQIVRAQGALVRALSGHYLARAAAERRRLFGHLIAAGGAARRQFLHAVDAFIADAETGGGASSASVSAAKEVFISVGLSEGGEFQRFLILTGLLFVL